MYAQAFSAAAGFILSICFSYIPGLKNRFDALDEKHGPEVGGNYKRLIMAGLIILVGLGSFGLACAGWLARFAPSLDMACTESGVAELILSIVFALAANQGTFALSPKKSG